MRERRLLGKSTLVTGASSGIGRATALLLAQEGAEVLATGRQEAALAALKRESQSFDGKLTYAAGDICDADFLSELVEAAGEVDILANNAGVLTYAPVLELTNEQIETMFRVNVLATFDLTRKIARGMVERKRGDIVMMTSLAARQVYRFGSGYCAAKHALTALTEGLRIELQEHGIRVLEVRPGMVATAMRDNVTHPAVLAAVGDRRYKPLTAEEVAEAVIFAVAAPTNCCANVIELSPVGAA